MAPKNSGVKIGDQVFVDVEGAVAPAIVTKVHGTTEDGGFPVVNLTVFADAQHVLHQSGVWVVGRRDASDVEHNLLAYLHPDDVDPDGDDDVDPDGDDDQGDGRDRTPAKKTAPPAKKTAGAHAV